MLYNIFFNFKMSAWFSDLPLELKYQILLDTDYKSLVSYCNSGIDIDAICETEDFWLMKLDKDFTVNELINGEHIVPSTYVKQYRRIVEEGSNVYKRWKYALDTVPWYHMERHDCELFERHMDVIMYSIDVRSVNLKDKTLQEFYNIIPIAAGCGELIILDKLSNIQIFSFIDAMSEALYYGQINVIKWLMERGVNPSEFDFLYFGRIHGIDHIAILNTLFENNFDFSQRIIDILIKTNNLQIVQWLRDHGYKLGVQEVASALSANAYNVVNWFIDLGIYPIQDDLNNKMGNINGIKYTPENYGLLLEFIKILDRLATRGIFPDAYYFWQAETNNIYDIAEWGKVHNIKYYHPRQRHILFPHTFDSPKKLFSEMDLKIYEANMAIAHKYEQFKPDDITKVLNPETGQWINVGSTKYKQLIKKGIIKQNTNFK